MSRPHIKIGEPFHIFIKIRQYDFCQLLECRDGRLPITGGILMKYLQMYSNNVRGNTNYNDHLQEAIISLNDSAKYQRTEGIPSHRTERSSIIEPLWECFLTKQKK